MTTLPPVEVNVARRIIRLVVGQVVGLDVHVLGQLRPRRMTPIFSKMEARRGQMSAWLRINGMPEFLSERSF